MTFLKILVFWSRPWFITSVTNRITCSIGDLPSHYWQELNDFDRKREIFPRSLVIIYENCQAFSLMIKLTIILHRLICMWITNKLLTRIKCFLRKTQTNCDHAFAIFMHGNVCYITQVTSWPSISWISNIELNLILVSA